MNSCEAFRQEDHLTEGFAPQTKRVDKEEEMEVVVTGSRELYYAELFYDGKAKTSAHRAEQQVWRELDDLQRELELEGKGVTRLHHGGAKGVDTYCANWAEAHDIPTVLYKPNWEKHGLGAGFKRNWRMLFAAAGGRVSQHASPRRAERLRTIERILKKAYSDPVLRKFNLTQGLADMREALLTPDHPLRRETLIRLRIPIPQDVILLAFWDGRSAGTRHCMKSAQALGFNVACQVYRRAPLPDRPQDRDDARIDHRPDLGTVPAFGSFMETGCGRN
jgi:hypothetical protein